MIAAEIEMIANRQPAIVNIIACDANLQYASAAYVHRSSGSPLSALSELEMRVAAGSALVEGRRNEPDKPLREIFGHARAS